ITTYTPTFSASYGIDFGNVFNAPALSDSGALRLSVSIPLDSFIPGTKNNAPIQRLEKQIEQRELELIQALDAARDDIAISVLKINNYAASIAALTLNEAVAERNYNLNYAAWQRGEIQYQDVIDAEESLESVRYQTLRERYNYHSQLLDLEYKLGISFAE
ncbi:MAG: TolC family protein, partial [Spirochaetaceae bacterium]|nr:TolC family protein [Spirochaetaceae bacterium]